MIGEALLELGLFRPDEFPDHIPSYMRNTFGASATEMLAWYA